MLDTLELLSVAALGGPGMTVLRRSPLSPLFPAQSQPLLHPAFLRAAIVVMGRDTAESRVGQAT
ncbi:hypothetical protein O7626_17155 [Micromonospora sp. WMMD1102]|uniref:hypothetical protein n=1 Tax=Micromonospora sp. WMMD1102 TaxID=3016105 RepID=UPI0024156CBE|nr:hypothetical protein [Micromonospora sp. WMMD1102]MDG4787644.1 hypothetical protein [Micromonospora sp. WMMD1102]